MKTRTMDIFEIHDELGSITRALEAVAGDLGDQYYFPDIREQAGKVAAALRLLQEARGHLSTLPGM